MEPNNVQPNQQQVTARIPYPERGVFEGETVSTTEHLMVSPQPVFIFEKVEYPEDGGIFIYLQDVLYPTKGFPTPEACQANNIAKRVLISQLRFFVKNPLAGVSLLRMKNFEKWLEEYHNVCYIVLGRYFLKQIRYQKTSRELWKFIRIFLNELGVKKTYHTDTDAYARNFVTLLEYDNAYMFRFQDLMNETSAKKLYDNPRKEILRLVEILNERDSRISMDKKLRPLIKAGSLLLVIPRIKKAFRKALEMIDFTHLQMDDNDRYQVLRWDKYNFFGQSLAERSKTYLEMHKGVLPRQYIIQHRSGNVAAQEDKGLLNGAGPKND